MAKAKEEKVYMTGYKGFNSDMTCRGFLFEEGKVYEEPEAELCKSGFHFCEQPMNVLQFYPLIGEDGKLNVFRKIEALDEATTDESKCKFVTKKLRVGAKVNIAGIVQAQIDFTRERAEKETAASGESGNAAASGVRGNAAASGVRGNAAASGESGNAAASGESGNAAASGWSGNAAASGWMGNAAASGVRGTAVATGMYGSAVACGEQALAVAWGNASKAKGAIGSWLVLTEYNDHDEIKDAALFKVDGASVQPDTWYILKDGKAVEYAENET